MLRSFRTAEDGTPTFALTYRGIAALGALAGIALTSLVLSVLSLDHASTARADLCMGLSRLAKIEHTLVGATAAQSKALIAKGFTFGIPKAELDRRVKEGEVTQARFLRELDGLSRC